MEEIFKQYGTPIIIAIVIVALIAIMKILLGTSAGSVVIENFKTLLQNFFRKAELTSTIIQALPFV